MKPRSFIARSAILSVTVLGVIHCGSQHPGGPDAEPSTPADDSTGDPSGSPSGMDKGGGGVGGSGGGDFDGATDPTTEEDGGTPSGPPPVEVLESKQVCKLFNKRFVDDPTPNDTHHRANAHGADLGIPVDLNDSLYLFFGDTGGYKGIWKSGSLPDAVGYSMRTTTEITADPSLLCDQMLLTTIPPERSRGPSIDSSIKADFSGNVMYPPPGHHISEYIKSPPIIGGKKYENIPGNFEVPGGAFAHNGTIYVFYTTVEKQGSGTMMASYLAKWKYPKRNGAPEYDILYQVDQRFNANGPLHGHFVNVAADLSPDGDYLYMFGTGIYRASPIYLARKKLADIEKPTGAEEYDPTTNTWYPQGKNPLVAPLVAFPGYGEISFRYFPEIQRWMMLTAGIKGTEASFAEKPEGPWTKPVVVFSGADPAFLAQYCCIPYDQCIGERFMNCGQTGPYGTYLFPRLQMHEDGSFTAIHTVSSFKPYNTALFTATFKLN